MKFDNRVAVITGAAGRIGRAAAALLGEYGVKIYLADINMEALQTVVAELAQHP